MNSLEQHVASLFAQGDRVVVGVSGGADSMALLEALCRCGKSLRLTVAHLNHRLRGEESERDEQFVSSWCARKGIRCEIRRLDIASLASRTGRSLELCGREERYAFFEELCGGQGYIATAHTLSDRVETLLFHLARGSSLAGLRSIPERRGNILRPLYPFTRAEIEAYCVERGVAYLLDSSNLSDDYARNRIRHRAVPALESVNPCFERAAQRLMDSIGRDEAYLAQQAQQAYGLAERPGGLDAASAAALPAALRSRVLAEFLRRSKVPVDAGLLERISALCAGAAGQQSAPGGRILRVRRGVLELASPLRKTPYFEYCWDHSEQCRVGNFWIIYCNRQKYNKFIKDFKNFFIYTLDYDRIFGNVKIRQRMPQDRLSLPRRGAKSLKKWMNELGIPEQRRWELGVFCDDQGLLGAEGIGVDRRAAATEQTAQYLLIVNTGEKNDR